MKIEGVSAGVSGREGEPSSVWIIYKGVSIHLAFLRFEDDRELERVCMNIYRYGSPGQLSKSKGYIVNEMKDNSRVVVVRPPFAENFAFFVRKFDTIENKQLDQLITDEGWQMVGEVLRLIVGGCQVSAITGAQGSGKTTLLMCLIGFISANFSLRIQEQAFELHLREIYPMRNILTFRETEYVSGQEGLDIQKKTDGVVNILGEVASNDVAAWMIQMSQVASLFTLFTHHAKTTENLVKYLRNALIINGNFNNERIALEQVIDAVRFDIHMERDAKGHRYIERISEIVTSQGAQLYTVRDVIRFDGTKYVIADGFSKEIAKEMSKRLSKEEVKILYENYCLQN
jgi:pilus assembly protein CpaF